MRGYRGIAPRPGLAEQGAEVAFELLAALGSEAPVFSVFGEDDMMMGKLGSRCASGSAAAVGSEAEDQEVAGAARGAPPCVRLLLCRRRCCAASAEAGERLGVEDRRRKSGLGVCGAPDAAAALPSGVFFGAGPFAFAVVGPVVVKIG